MQADNPVLGVAATAASGGIVPDPDTLYDVPASGPSLDGHDLELTTGCDTLPMDRVTDIQVPAPPNGGMSRPRQLVLSGQPEDEEIEPSWPSKSAVHHARRRLEAERRRAQQQQQESLITDISRRIESADAPESGRTSQTLPRPTMPKSVPVANEYARAEPVVAQHNRATPNVTATPPVARTVYVPPVAEPHHGDDTMASDAHQETEQLPTRDVRDAILGGHTGPRYADPLTGSGNGHEPYVHVDGAIRTSPQVRRDSHVRIDLQLAEPTDPVDRVNRLATLPRCCGTCRDFRQQGNGERGWCTNAYAFGERRMVQSDELACRSSLGMWWMPNDDVWLERADTSHHGRPTPLLDASLRAQRSGESGRESHA